MRIVLCSDVHGNVAALEAVLADIEHEVSPDLLFVAGDLAVFGPRPAESLARLRALKQTRFVMGNTDQYLIDGMEHAAIDFARARLSDDDMAFLSALPFSQRLEVAPGHHLLVVHANPRNLEDLITLETSAEDLRQLMQGESAEIVAFGHYHVPFVRSLSPWTLIDVASVGLPRDGDQRAVYVVLTWNGRGWQIEHRRVPFDVEAVARDYQDVGYPDAEAAGQRLREAR